MELLDRIRVSRLGRPEMSDNTDQSDMLEF